MLQLLDAILFTAHIALISFNLLGWIWPRTRKWHLAAVIITFLSWLIPGFWYGFGYCFLTDWHWDVKRRLGETDLPPSFVQYLTNDVFGLDWSASFVDTLTVVSLVVVFVLSVGLNFLKRK